MLAAIAPAWSPDGNWIAYIATEDSGMIDGSFTRADWKLFYESVDPFIGLQIDRLLVDGVTCPGTVKWSPSGDKIAFSADVNGEEGIWIVDRVTRELTRHWERQAMFDWAPDGTRLIVVDYEDFLDLYARPQPHIISVTYN